MALFSTLASLSQTAASNAADGSVDAPATIDNQLNLLASFIAQLRDANGFTTGIGYTAQCRLVKSGSNLVLQRYNGAGLTINGVTYSIPSGGVSLAPTSLTPGTTYYIYAYMNAGTMTLEASTTTHATDTTTGIEIKSGDSTRTLVGMARPITGPAWQDANAQRFVLSWFNRRALNCGPSVLAADTGVASLSNTEISTSLRAEFLLWSGDSARFGFEGSCFNNVQHAVTASLVSLDGTTVNDSYSSGQHYQASALIPVSCSMTLQQNVAEGYHYATAMTRQNVVSTSTFIGGGTSGSRCALTGVVQG